MGKSDNLPSWAHYEGTTRRGWPIVIVDPEKMFTSFLGEYGIDLLDITQYWLEVCYQSMKMDLQTAIRQNIEIRINVDAETKQKWRHAAWPAGRCTFERNKDLDPVVAASVGKEARYHYGKLRGSLPKAPAVDSIPPAPSRKKAK